MERYLYPIGRVVKAHGVRGKLKVEYFGENPDRFSCYQKIFIRDNLGRPQPYDVLEVTPQLPRLILRLKGIERIEETGHLLGKEILVRREDFAEPEEGEYYWFEILGMAVETEQGKRIGTVKEIFPTGAHDVFVVYGKRREILLPAIGDVIRRIDRQKRMISVVWMKGLWEDEDEI